jgi:O-antigen/teichoic acid export membrane protein
MAAGIKNTLGERVRDGAAWGSINIVASRLLQFGTTLLLARIIAPDQFGALAIAVTVQALVLNLVELGVTADLARGDGDPRLLAPTIFTIAAANGIFVTLLMWTTAGPVAAAFGDPTAAPVVQILSITVLLSSFASVPTTMLWRDFLQKRRFIVELSALLVTVILVVPLALFGLGALAIAWSRVGGTLVSTVGYWIATPRRFLPGWNSAIAVRVLRIGLPLAAANILALIVLNVDYFFVGRHLGATALGLYSIAFSLAALPSGVFTSIVRTFAVPVFGRLHATGDLAAASGRIMRAMAWAAFPVSAMIAGLGTPLLVSLYGERWSAAGSALIGLGVFGAARVITEVLADVCVGAGRTGGLFWAQIVWVLALVPTMYFLTAAWGISGAGAAHALVTWIIVIPAYLIAVKSAAGIRVSDLLTPMGLPLIAAIIAGVVAWWTSSLLNGSWGSLALGAGSGLACYLLLTHRTMLFVTRGVLTGSLIDGSLGAERALRRADPVGPQR